MIRIGGSGYPLLAEDKIAPPAAMIYGGTTSQTRGVYTLDEHYRNVGWCRGFDEFTETFDSLDPAWDVSELASAVISGGKLVTQGVIGTLGKSPMSGAFVEIPPIYGDFEISVDISWVANGSNPMASIFLMLRDSDRNTIARCGMDDGWASELGRFSCQCGSNIYSSGKVAPTTGSMTVRITRNDGEVDIFLSGTKRVTTSGVTTPVAEIALSNTRYTASYSGYTVSYDNLYLKRRR